MDEAVKNALCDLVFGMMHLQSAEGRSLIVKNLLAMTKVMNRAKANAIKERSVTIEERKLVLMNKAIELKRKQLEQETEGTAKKRNKGRPGHHRSTQPHPGARLGRLQLHRAADPARAFSNGSCVLR